MKGRAVAFSESYLRRVRRKPHCSQRSKKIIIAKQVSNNPAPAKRKRDEEMESMLILKIFGTIAITTIVAFGLIVIWSC